MKIINREKRVRVIMIITYLVYKRPREFCLRLYVWCREGGLEKEAAVNLK